MNSLLSRLTSYSQSDYYPFHMPGHKRRPLAFPNPWSIDLTEITDFDNLHHAEGILLKLQERAARLFGARKSFCLVNGSTCGILAAVSACTKPGGKLLMSRNCHKSVYHGVSLRNLTPVYLMPELSEYGIMGSVSPEQVEHAFLKHPDLDAVLVVSPTYDGVVSDLKSIAAIAHSHGVPFIVDEAHGAHFPFSRRFPASALSLGADLVIQSLHKTLPAFTQTALLHIQSDRIAERKIHRFLGLYQTSSPSYLLMASMEECFRLLETEGEHLFDTFHKNLSLFYEKCRNLTQVQVYPAFGYARDMSKILISAEKLGISGQKLADLLREEFHLELEMASGHYALALSGLMDTEEGFSRLFHALSRIDRPSLYFREKNADIIHNETLYRIPKQDMTPAQALEKDGTDVLLSASAGRISREYLYLYPPGIPLLTPGERIDEELLSALARLKKLGLQPEGLWDMTNQWINVVNSSII